MFFGAVENETVNLFLSSLETVKHARQSVNFLFQLNRNWREQTLHCIIFEVMSDHFHVKTRNFEIMLQKTRPSKEKKFQQIKHVFFCRPH